MCTSACALSSSSLVSPVRSAPNTTAAGARRDSLTMRAAASRTSITRKYWSRSREVVAATKPQPASASASEPTRRAHWRTSSAPEARALATSSKGRNDFVTEVDHAAEREIIGIIRRHYPQHAFLAEESGRTGEHDTLWIIDPLDGTTNFLHGFPVFAVSIAAQVRGRLEHAVVYDPMRGELFTASRGAAAALDDPRRPGSNARAP